MILLKCVGFRVKSVYTLNDYIKCVITIHPNKMAVWYVIIYHWRVNMDDDVTV